MPRETRIAKILAAIVEEKQIVMVNPETLGTIANELEPYARRDFAVRYGRLEDIGTTRHF